MTAFNEISFAQVLMQSGVSPWWNPSLSCGAPLFGQPGLAMGYPGILLAVMLPFKMGMALFFAAHLGLAYAGALKFAAGLKTRMPLHAFAILWAALSLALGWNLEPAYSAAFAWLPWALASRPGAPQFACWAMLLSCAEPWSAGMAVLGALVSSERRARLKVAPLAAIAMALPLWATFQAARLTSPSRGGAPLLDALGREELALKARGFRVFAGEGLDTAPARPGGPSWVFGSRRPLKGVAELEQSFGQAGGARDNFLNLWGVSIALSRVDGRAQPSRLRTPVRAALVSAARVYRPVQEIFDMEARPFYSRPLLLEQPDARVGTGPGGAVWTMLQALADAGGGLRVTLPEKHEASWLYVSDAWYPGWEARSESGPKTILKAEQAFRALWVEAGDQSVSFRYRPWPIYGAWLISLFTLIFSAAGGLKKAGLG